MRHAVSRPKRAGANHPSSGSTDFTGSFPVNVALRECAQFSKKSAVCGEPRTEASFLIERASIRFFPGRVLAFQGSENGKHGSLCMKFAGSGNLRGVEDKAVL